MFNAANILEALKNYIHTRGGTSNAYNIAEAVNDLNSIPQSSGGDIPPEVSNSVETHGMGWTSEEEVEGFDITWDGNTEGLEWTGNYVKISDLDIRNDQIVGLKYDLSYASTHEFKRTIEITQEDFDSLVDVGGITEDFSSTDSFIIIHKDGIVVEDIEFAHKGIYHVAEGATLYTSRIYKEASTEEVVHQIDQKYIPQGSSGGGMVVKVTADPETFALSADKTFAEIQEAFRAGVNVIANLYVGEEFDDLSASCIACGRITAYFGTVFIDEETLNVRYDLQCVSEDGVDNWSSPNF